MEVLEGTLPPTPDALQCGRPASIAPIPGCGTALFNPCGLAIGFDGCTYIADTGNHRICMLSTDGVLSVVAGSGETLLG